MNREQLENLLIDISGHGSNLTRLGVLHAQRRVLAFLDKYERIANAAEDVVRNGSSSERYFDGRELGNAPSHRHKEPPKWDMTGETCTWCSSWMLLRKLLEDRRE